MGFWFFGKKNKMTAEEEETLLNGGVEESSREEKAEAEQKDLEEKISSSVGTFSLDDFIDEKKLEEEMKLAAAEESRKEGERETFPRDSISASEIRKAEESLLQAVYSEQYLKVEFEGAERRASQEEARLERVKEKEFHAIDAYRAEKEEFWEEQTSMLKERHTSELEEKRGRMEEQSRVVEARRSFLEGLKNAFKKDGDKTPAVSKDQIHIIVEAPEISDEVKELRKAC